MPEAILKTSIVQENKRSTEWISAKAVYTGLMAFNLLSYIWMMAIGSSIEIPVIIWIARIVTAPLAIYYGKLWKNKGFRILLVYTLVFFMRCYLADQGSIFNSEFAQNLLSAIWLFAGCYGLGAVLSIRQQRIFLNTIVCIWLIWIFALSCIGIYAAWVYQSLFFDGFAPILTWNLRLELFYPATTTGSILGISFLLAILLAFCNHKRYVKWGFVFISLPIFLAMALTDSRTAYISTAAGLSSMISVFIYHNKNEKTFYLFRNQKWKQIMIVMVIMIVVFILTVLIILQITPLFNHLKTIGIIPRAYAEDKSDTQLLTRKFDGHVLSGRAELWERAVNYIKENPLVLLYGNSKNAPLRGYDAEYSHNHSLYLQVLIESGIAGLLCVLFFLGYSIIQSIKLIKDDSPLWIVLLVSMIVSLCVGDIAECFLWLRSSQCPMSAVLFISAGIVSSKGEKRQDICIMRNTKSR